jgi:microsomal dipeptidase-like Zn-dependent dipeptidase
MLRKIIRFLVSILLILIVVFFFVVGKITDRVYNKVEDIPEIQLSQETKKLHSKILVADLHADNLLWDRDPLDRLSHGAVDIPRLIEGGYALQVFDAVIKTPKNQNYTSNTGDTDNIQLLAMANRWPISSWFNLTERALHQSEILHEAANESPNLEIIKSKEDLRYFLSLRKSNSYKVGGILSIEGLHALENEFSNLQVLYDAGYRMMGLVHFFDNEVGGSSAGVDQGGLTDFGRRIVKEMERRQIIIDLAHASPADC